MESVPRHLSQIQKMESNELFALEDQVNALEQDPAFKRILEIAQRLADKSHIATLHAQKPLEQAEYAQRLGFENGCRLAGDIVESVKAIAASRRADLEAARAREAQEAAGEED